MMASGRKATEQVDARNAAIEEIAFNYQAAFRLGACEGLGSAAEIAVMLGARDVLEAIILSGKAKYPRDFVEELKKRRIVDGESGVQDG